MTPAVLLSVAAEVEAGQGENQLLRFDIARAIGWALPAPFPAWEVSVDAVIALIEERLPERRYFLQAPDGYIDGVYQDGEAVAVFSPTSSASSALMDWALAATAPTAPRALLAATLRAIDALAQQSSPTEQEDSAT